MRPWRRRKQAPPPVVLPSLDRLAGLIERVVELVDEVAGAAPTNSVEPTQASETSDPAVAAREPTRETDDGRGWIAFVPSVHGYTLVPQEGSAPEPGEPLELDGVAFRVLRLAPSPLPGDLRRCVVVEREEPPEADRSFGE